MTCSLNAFQFHEGSEILYSRWNRVHFKTWQRVMGTEERGRSHDSCAKGANCISCQDGDLSRQQYRPGIPTLVSWSSRITMSKLTWDTYGGPIPNRGVGEEGGAQEDNFNSYYYNPRRSIWATSQWWTRLSNSRLCENQMCLLTLHEQILAVFLEPNNRYSCFRGSHCLCTSECYKWKRLSCISIL